MSWEKQRAIKHQRKLDEMVSRGLTRESLYDLYWNKKLSLPDLDEMFKGFDVWYWMEEWGIPRRKTGQGFHITKSRQLEERGITKELLDDLYTNKRMSLRKISKLLHIPAQYYFEQFGITKRKNTDNNRHWKRTSECRNKIAAKSRERFANPEEREKLRLLIEKRLAIGWRPNTKAANEKTRQLWRNPKYKEERLLQVRHHLTKPNKIETRLLGLIEKACPNEYTYTGNGKMIINSMIPDFTNRNGQKKVIELFGNYWHKPGSEAPRIVAFKEMGWDCLVLWESDIKLKRKEQELVSVIKAFNEGGQHE